MELNFTQALLNLLAILGIAFVVCFLFYGMLKGVNMEKEMRLRNRRRYS
ncbi:MAG TPA: hypothetical protein PL009_13170 [Flavipsychrobacter sp.]|nr:hypothetical protein [Flavipsychrobacter sp.]